jgi:hypothetical protein
VQILSTVIHVKKLDGSSGINKTHKGVMGRQISRIQRLNKPNKRSGDEIDLEGTWSKMNFTQ